MLKTLKKASLGGLCVVTIWMLAALLGLAMVGHADAAASGWRLERVVVVMRHGIRPPTKAQVVPDGFTARTWPDWDVPYGYLTGHGALAIAKLGAFDRQTYGAFLGSGCNGVRVVADVDERTLKTAESYAGALLPGCDVAVEHVALDQADARFSPFEAGRAADGQAMLAAAEAAAGPMAAIDARYAPLLKKLDGILGCCQAPACPEGAATCGLEDMSTGLVVKNNRVVITGGLDRASTLAQVLLLEYADGKPADQVGWGRADRAAIAQLSAFHALEFRLVARPKPIADFAAAPLLAEVKRGLFATDTAKYTVLVGHDSNLAYIGGALDLHWKAGDLMPDDPAPGGALVFEKWRNARGEETVIVRYRAQTLDQMRDLSALTPAASNILKQPDCAGRTACVARRFEHLLDATIRP